MNTLLIFFASSFPVTLETRVNYKEGEQCEEKPFITVIIISNLQV